MNISKLNVTTLNRQQATDAQLMRKHNVEVNIPEQPTQQVGNGVLINRDDITVRLGGDMAHFNFITDMEGVSEDDKRNLLNVISSAVKQPAGGTGDYFVMHRAQTKAQLQLVADKLIPPQYAANMQEAINSYAEEGLDLQVRMYEAGQASMDELREQYPSLKKSTMGTEGIARLKELEKFTSALYDGLDYSTQSTFVQSFESALHEFTAQQQQLHNSSQHVLQQYKEELRAKWNDFASLFQDESVYKLPTKQESVIDVRL